MIDIINGFGFKRNFDNSVLYSLDNVASVLEVQPYVIKEHYFHCVADRCFSEGEFHKEEVIGSIIDVFIPCKSLGNLIDSLTFERIIEGEQVDNIMRVLAKHVETQNIVSECFDKFCYDYSDPIRKVNDSLPPVSDSITRHKD